MRNDRAFHRARGTRIVWMRVSYPVCRSAHGQWSSSSLSRTGPRKQIVACVPHAMDFAACCIADRELPLAPTPPGPRELSRGHALGPSARRVGVNLPSDCGSPAFARNLVHSRELAAFRPDIVAATASRCHVTMTIATRPSPERDGSDDNCPIADCKNKIGTFANYFF